MKQFRISRNASQGYHVTPSRCVPQKGDLVGVPQTMLGKEVEDHFKKYGIEVAPAFAPAEWIGKNKPFSLMEIQ